MYSGVKPSKPLSVWTSLLRDGRVVSQSPLTALPKRTTSTEVSVVPMAGSLTLGPDMPPGPCTLQLTVTEAADTKHRPRAQQWADFEVLLAR